MEFLLLCLATSVLSLGMEMANELRVFKDAADNGYKINWEKLTELGQQVNLKELIVSLLVPFFNMFKVLQNTVDFNNQRAMMLTQFKVMGLLEEMNEIEKNEYLKKPTALNALLVPIKIYRRAMKAEFVQYEDGEIYYERSNNFDEITILRVTGTATNLSADEQKKIVLNLWQETFASARCFDDYEDFKQNIFGDSLTSEEKDDFTKKLLQLNEEKQTLNDFKNELLGQVQQNDCELIQIKKLK